MKFRSDRMRIAIVGCAYRMPGVDSEHFWQALLEGRSLVGSVPADRWAHESLLHPRKNEPGTAYTFAAGSLLGDIASFDAAFFGISPREAEQMDPQQRLLLEMAWEAFEDAGIPTASMRGERCGVYVGLSSIDYAYRRADDLGAIDASTMTGNTGSIAANRISYLFDLRGPSMALDTACSSSLVALHQACQSIRQGESAAALVAGISLHLHPFAFVGFSKASMLSRHGRCEAFGEGADGYVRGEGGAVLLLKPLAQAIGDGNRILGVIAETGINNDGRKHGLTVPSHAAQAALLRDVYARAGIDAIEIDYLEAHGTGTAVGDPIEAQAIGEALGRQRPAERPLAIGSVKANVGHLEAASGMAGLVKALHVLRHRCVPAQPAPARWNPHIDFAALNLAPLVAPLQFESHRRLVVGVSSFGFGGTNAHAILTSFESDRQETHAVTELRTPLMLSARSAAALRESARCMAQYLQARTDLSDYDIAYSAMQTRDVHRYRLSVGPAERSDMVLALECFATTGSAGSAGSAPAVLTGTHRPDASPPAFVYSGNGSQWLGMGVKLLDEDPTFLEAIEEVDALYAALAGWSILGELRAAPAASRLECTDVAQPLLFALQVGVTRALEHRRIQPAAVCGHSVGEITAAWASGALTLQQAARVVYERSRHQVRTRGRGCMLAVELGEASVGTLLQSLALDTAMSIAAVNTAGSVTLSGPHAAIERVMVQLKTRRVASRRLPMDYAFHSATMEDIREDLHEGLQGLSPRSAAVPLYSAVTGARVAGQELDARYWWRNVREPVRFQATIQAMLADGINTFVEVGPKPVLSSYIREITGTRSMHGSGEPKDSSAFVLPALTMTECGRERLGSVAMLLELSGVPLERNWLFPAPGRWVPLPHYPWQRERYWQASTPDSLGLLQRRLVHPLLGYALPGEPWHWENRLDTTKLPAYADHVVDGAVVFPAAGFVEMALAAALTRRPGIHPIIEDLEIISPLLLEAQESRTVRLRIDDADGSFRISSRSHAPDAQWRIHAVGRLLEGSKVEAAAPLTLPTRAPEISGEAHYALARSRGLQYGPAFQSVTEAWFESVQPESRQPDSGQPAQTPQVPETSVVGRLTLPTVVAEEAQTMYLHPASLDGALQLLLGLTCRLHGDAANTSPNTFLPVRFERLQLLQPGARVAAARVCARAPRHPTSRSVSAQLSLYDAHGEAVALVQGARLRVATLQRGRGRSPAWLTTKLVAMPRRAGKSGLQTSAEAVALPATPAAVQLAAAHLHEPQRVRSRLRYAREVEPLLEALCAAFAERTVRAIAGAAPDPQPLIASGRLAASAEPLYRRLLQILCEEELLDCIEGRWQWRGQAPEGKSAGLDGLHFPPPEQIWETLIADYPEHGILIARLGSAGLRLPERLRAAPARVSPEEAATACESPDSLDWTSTCTQSDALAFPAAIEALLQAGAQLQPAHARLRILHVLGAAVPEGPAGVLPGCDLSACESVIMVSNREGMENLHACLRARPEPAMRPDVRVIDLDRAGPTDLEALGHFDIVVLGQGLTGATDPDRRLQQLRRLLFDGGWLLLVEQPPSRLEDLICGFDPARRQPHTAQQTERLASRRLTAHAWQTLLSARGFADVGLVADTPQGNTGPYVLIARADSHANQQPHAHDAIAPLPSTAKPDSSAGRTWLLLQDASGYSAQLASELAAHLANDGQRLITVQNSPQCRSHAENHFELDPASSQHWTWLLTELERSQTRPDAWIHLGGLQLRGAQPNGAQQTERIATLTAWLQACSTQAISPDCWVIGARAGAALLPPVAREPAPQQSGAAARESAEAHDCPREDTSLIEPLRDAALWGMTRVATQEFPQLAVRWVDLLEPLPCSTIGARLAQELLEPDAEQELLLTAQGRFVTRLIAHTSPPQASAPTRTPERSLPPSPLPVQLDFSSPGSTRNLHWREAPSLSVTEPLQADEVEVEVRAAGLNFRDLMYGMGLLPDEALENGFCGPTLGMELAGVVCRVGPAVTELKAGEQVMGLSPASFATHARTRAFALTRKPADWSFEAAASVPSAFFTAYYALVELAGLRAGERVLIHGAAGGVGMAAIQIARQIGAEILATAGSDEKRDVVGLLGADHVFDSRSLSFADQVRAITGGAGVDVVLNSLAGEAMRRSLALLRPFGRMIELGKRDFYENTRLGLRPLRNNIAYFGVDADQLLAQRPDVARRVFEQLMQWFARGQLHPLPHRCFAAAEADAAFRYMQASRHMGKIVIRFDERCRPRPAGQPRLPPLQLRPEATYLVTGGLSGFGLRTAEWLASRGARHLALLGRHGAHTAESEAALARLATTGVNAQALCCDVADEAALSAALDALRSQMPPLRGLVHAAAVIEDALIRDLSSAQLLRVLAPKLAGALNLHRLTRDLPLDFFVLYSSATTLFGNPGQGAYVAANLALETLAAQRRAAGLPATCVSWGPIGDAGYLARNERVREALVARLGGRALSCEEALSALESLLQSGGGLAGWLQLDWAALGRSLPRADAARFVELARDGDQAGPAQESTQQLRLRLEQLPPDQLLPELLEIVRHEVAQITRLPADRIDPAVALADIGMDSLMAVELAMSLETRLGIQLSALALGDGPTIERVAALLVQQFHGASGASGASADGGGAGEDSPLEQVRVVAARYAGEIGSEQVASLGEEIMRSPRPLLLGASPVLAGEPVRVGDQSRGIAQ